MKYYEILPFNFDGGSDDRRMKPAAQHASFAFAQHTEDGKCHMSFNTEGGHVNMEISMHDASAMLQNLARVMNAEIERLQYDITVLITVLEKKNL